MKRSVYVTRLMGINEVEIILLDSDSRVSTDYVMWYIQQLRVFDKVLWHMIRLGPH